jgi:hypothetical protein
MGIKANRMRVSAFSRYTAWEPKGMFFRITGGLIAD